MTFSLRLLLALSLFTLAARAAERLPNIIFVLADDLGTARTEAPDYPIKDAAK